MGQIIFGGGKMQDNNSLEILTSSEAAIFLRLSEEELINALERNEIPGLKIAGKWRIQKETLEKLLGSPTLIQRKAIESKSIANLPETQKLQANAKAEEVNSKNQPISRISEEKENIRQTETKASFYATQSILSENELTEFLGNAPYGRLRGYVFSYNTINKIVKVRMADGRVVQIEPSKLINSKVLPVLDDVVEFELFQKDSKLEVRSVSIISRFQIGSSANSVADTKIESKNVDHTVSTPVSTLTSTRPNPVISSPQSTDQRIDATSQSVLLGSSATDQFSKGKKEFTNGNVKTALEYLERAYQQGERNSQIYLFLGQTLQRLEKYDKAHEYLDIGIRAVKSTEQRLPLINAKAQIFSSQGQLRKAAETYEQLMKLENRSTARRYTRIQLVRLYRSLDEIDKAKTVINQLIQESPQDQVALRLMTALDHPIITKLQDTTLIEDETVRELEVDLPEIDLISPMLKQDLAIAEYRDEKILRQGGRPEVNDADRILRDAEKEKGTEFGERYPLFLEAAKAYSELPEGAYALESFHRALARYAMLKGGALVSEFRRRANSENPNLQALFHLRDSATSYYLESLAIQMNLDEKFALVALANYLRAQIVYALICRQEYTPSDIFERGFSDLFGFCLGHKDQEITHIAYSAVISWGAAGGDIWNRLQQLPGGAGVVAGTLFKRNTRIRPYKILSAISGQSFTIDQRPGEVLKILFLERRRQQQEIQSFFTRLQQMPLDIRNSRDLQEQWKNLPLHRGALLDTDFEIHEGISSILATLLPYQTRSPEERAAILFTVRTSIEHLLDFIEANPTYWGRVGFEPLLTKWQSAIRSTEQRRLGEIQPRFVIRLEPPVFHLEGEFATGGVNLHNIGRATAEGVVIGIQLRDETEGTILLEVEEKINDEIAVDKTSYHSLRFPVSTLSQGITVPYRLRVKISPIFRQIRLDASEDEFTLQVHSGSTFSLPDIPWNELKIPPKHLFKGREKLIHRLVDHLVSSERNKTYILYGLTRTGKSSILNYLGKQLDLKEEKSSENINRFISFNWDLGRAKGHSNASDMWGYLLGEQVVSKLALLAQRGEINAVSVPPLRSNTSFRFKDWEPILLHLQRNHLYPIFLIDEFSYYRELVDSKRIDASFLAAIRAYAIGGQASFVIAGTYDLQNLIKDPAYGITGQFVNAIETQVSRIDSAPAIELIQVMEPQLRFTPDAINHVLQLSYQIPYFIQILCKNCAIYALNTGRNIIGFPEVEAVVKALVSGEVDDPHLEDIQRIPPGQFMNNMYNPSDPPEFGALISTIASLTFNQLTPRKVTYSEIHETWDRHRVRLFQARLARATKELCDREILNSSDDDGMPAYQISVDLFRRWWSHEHRHLALELDALKQEE